MGSFFGGIVNWLLKLLLNGLFKQVTAQIEDAAQAKVDAAKIHAQSAQESADVEVKISQAQTEVDHKFDTQAANPSDPFHSDDWNQGVKAHV